MKTTSLVMGSKWSTASITDWSGIDPDGKLDAHKLTARLEQLVDSYLPGSAQWLPQVHEIIYDVDDESLSGIGPDELDEILDRAYSEVLAELESDAAWSADAYGVDRCESDEV